MRTLAALTVWYNGECRGRRPKGCPMNEMKLPGFICIVAQAFYRCQESCSIVLESLKYLVAHLVFLSRREYHMLLWERWPSAVRTERVDTLRKHAGGMFLVSISAAMLP